MKFIVRQSRDYDKNTVEIYLHSFYSDLIILNTVNFRFICISDSI